MASVSVQLARLPPELVDLILSFAGIDVCIAVRHLPCLRDLLVDYTKRGDFSIVLERRLLQALLDAGWSAGVRLYIDHDLLDSLGNDGNFRRANYFEDEPPVCWDRVTLPVATLEKLESFTDDGVVPFDVLTYNLFASGASGDRALKWMSAHVAELGGQLIKRSASIEYLRKVCQLVNTYTDDRQLAETFIPCAARHGRRDLVVFWDGLYPELLLDDDTVLRQAVKGGHLDIVQYVYERQPRSTHPYFDIAAHRGHESVARWLFDLSPHPVDGSLVLDLARHNCAGLLESLWAERRLVLPTPDYDDIWRYWPGAAGKAASQSNNPKVWQTLMDCLQQAEGFLQDHDAGRFISVESIKWLVERNAISIEYILEELAATGRGNLVKWMFAEFPSFTNTRHIQEALAAGHFELGQWMACEMGVPLSGCCPTSRQLQRAVLGGRLDVLLWIDKHCGGGLQCTLDLFDAAIDSRNLGIVQLLYARSPDIVITPTMLECACEGGNLALVRWVYRRLITVDDWSYEFMAAHFPLVEWLRSSTSVQVLSDATKCAAQSGRLDVVRFLVNDCHGYVTTPALVSAVSGGCTATLELMHARYTGELSPDAPEWSVVHGPLDTLRWLLDRYPTCLTASMIRTATRYNDINKIRYYHTVPGAPFTAEVMDEAAGYGYVDLIRWLHDNRTEGCTAQSMASAARHGLLSVVKFLHKHDYPQCSDDVVEESPANIQRWFAGLRRNLMLIDYSLCPLL
ncbi:hypothetical protein RI367_005335 [Sorochytrium milnesiophthora]